MGTNVEKCVMISLNGEPLLVKARTISEQETRDVLGIEPTDQIALDHALHCPLDFSRGWGFAEGQRYAVVKEVEAPESEASPEDKQPWVTDADAWKGDGWKENDWNG